VSNPVVRALEQAAERVGRTLSKDAGRAVEQLYRETGHRAETVVKRIVDADAQHANTILDLAEQIGRVDGRTAARGSAQNAERAALRQRFADILAPKQLEAGRAARSVRQLRNLRDPQTRWRAAEENARQRYGGGPERAYPVPATDDPLFPIRRATVRKVDCPVDLPGGGTLAVEVKMYQQYRRVELAPGQFAAQPVQVPLSGHIREQIAKDVALRTANPSYDPRWEFLGAGPSQELRDELTRAGVIFLEHH
jgi:hypothetical protein